MKELIDKECRRRHKSGELAGEHVSELLAGERRVRERTNLETWLDEHGLLGAAQQRPSAPVFLVATSAGEVGVDLNADHMVCDLVAHERMVQRLGRVNRRGGEDRRATIDVLAQPPEMKDKAPKDAKEKAERDFDARLAPLHRLPGGEDGRRDASPAAIVELKAKHPDVVRAATTPAPLHPELTRPLLDAWSMTSLRHHEGRPEVAPWLRGWEDDDEPQTAVVWRRYLPCVRTSGEATAPPAVPPAMVAEYFRAVPVHATERLEAGSSRVLDWMLKRWAQLAKRPEDHDPAIGDDEIAAILIDRAGEYVAHLTLRELRRLAVPAGSFLQKGDLRQRDRSKREWRDRYLPGATLVADSRLCGVRDGMLNEKCEDTAAAADADDDWMNMKEPAAGGSHRLIGFLVEKVDGGEDEEGLEPPDRGDWRHIRTFETDFDAGGVARGSLAVFKWPEDPSDEDSRSVLSAPQSLRDHAEHVAEHARALARRLDLPREEAEALVIAARLHDHGKAAERWQNAIRTAASLHGVPFAATSPSTWWPCGA